MDIVIYDVHVVQVVEGQIQVGATVAGEEVGAGPYTFEAFADVSALSATVNAAIKSAAIAQMSENEHTVGGLDKKTIFGAAVGL